MRVELERVHCCVDGDGDWPDGGDGLLHRALVAGGDVSEANVPSALVLGGVPMEKHRFNHTNQPNQRAMGTDLLYIRGYGLTLDLILD